MLLCDKHPSFCGGIYARLSTYISRHWAELSSGELISLLSMTFTVTHHFSVHREIPVLASGLLQRCLELPLGAVLKAGRRRHTPRRKGRRIPTTSRPSPFSFHLLLQSLAERRTTGSVLVELTRRWESEKQDHSAVSRQQPNSLKNHPASQPPLVLIRCQLAKLGHFT